MNTLFVIFAVIGQKKQKNIARASVIAKVESFATYLKTHYPKLTRVDQVRPLHVQAFLEDLEQSGVTAETWNKYLVPIKTVLKRAGVPAAKEILAQDVETVYRKPYTIEELRKALQEVIG